MGRDDWLAPARMALVAVPAYATPMLAMSQLGMMFQHANSPGAAFILLVIGAGMNFGTIAWMSRQFGWRNVAVWFSCLMTVVVLIAYAVNKPLIPPGVNPSGHTHAFDIYTNPIHHLDSTTGDFARRKLAESYGLVEQICLSIFAIMGLAGALLRITGITSESLAVSPSEPESLPTEETLAAAHADASLGFDRIVGSQVVGGTLIAGLIVISVVMCYAFYPSPRECMEEIRIIRAEALSGAISGDVEHTKFWIPQWDQWSRRMEVGAFLRTGHVTEYQRMQGFLLRKKLDVLEHELDHDHEDPVMMRELVDDILFTNSRWLKAYREPFDPAKPLPEPDLVAIQPDRDVQHEHQHIHGDGKSHDHQHPDFAGTHDHDHEHQHRHDDAPHGGRIISLGHQQHLPDLHNPHLEVMPIQDETLVIYPLQEMLGVLRPIKVHAGTLTIHLTTTQTTQSGDEEMEMNWDAASFRFQTPLPDAWNTLNTEHVTGDWVFPDGTKLNFTFSLH